MYGNALLIYMMDDAKQWNEAVSVGKRHTDCSTHRPSLSAKAIRLENHEMLAILVLVRLMNSAVDCSI